MGDRVSYASFMIRVWRAPADEADSIEAVWVGEIESVQSGRVVPFKGLAALAELLVGSLSESGDLREGGVGSEDPTLL